MALLPVDEALARILDGAAPVASETVSIEKAGGRVLAAGLAATRDQPPFPASAMDGYAVRASDIADPPATLRVVGQSAAGRGFRGRVEAGEAVRVFTGAPIPEGSDTVLIQEDARQVDETRVEALDATAQGRHIRAAGLDFRAGQTVLAAGRALDPAELALAAAAGHARLEVVARPLVAILATGDELVPPGKQPGPDQIVSSNNVAIAEICRRNGGLALDLGIAADSAAAISSAIGRAVEAGADIVVTIGGASVGDHDLVRPVLLARGTELDFWKIAMRPGKPLMFGRLGGTRVLGLPGNPVSAIVCATIFLAPLVARLAGRSFALDIRAARLGRAMPANAERRDYVRCRLAREGDGLVATPFHLQDSSMLSTLAASDALVLREPMAPAAEAGQPCQVLMLRGQ